MNVTPFQILIIDDDESFAHLLKIRLKTFIENPFITEFRDLTSARGFLKETRISDINLVVLDMHLPDGKGLDILQEGWFKDLAVLAVSSDDAPEIPGATLKGGATYFLNKNHISQPLFQPLVEGIIDRNRLQMELNNVLINEAVLESVKTLVATLRHEINNPLGAVLGAAYLLENNPAATDDQREAAKLVESSGQRIKHVLDQLCDTVELEGVTKGRQKVYHIPGDKPWDDGDGK
jgi:signal transduction histidine kinase